MKKTLTLSTAALLAVLATGCSGQAPDRNGTADDATPTPTTSQWEASHGELPAASPLKPEDHGDDPHVWANTSEATSTGRGAEVFTYYDPAAKAQSHPQNMTVAVIFPDQQTCHATSSSKPENAKAQLLQKQYDDVYANNMAAAYDAQQNDEGEKYTTGNTVNEDAPTLVTYQSHAPRHPHEEGTLMEQTNSVVKNGDGEYEAVNCALVYSQVSGTTADVNWKTYDKAVSDARSMARTITASKAGS